LFGNVLTTLPRKDTDVTDEWVGQQFGFPQEDIDER